jgi:hypothetical protein
MLIDMIYKPIIFCIIFLCLVSIASATTYNAASCSQANVQTAVNSATDGDIVQIPSCTSTDWSTYVTVNQKAITIQGTGKATTIIRATGNGSYAFFVPNTNTKMVKFYDMTITQADRSCGAPLYSCGAIKIDGGITGSPTFVIGRVSFDHSANPNFSARGLEVTNGLTGLLHHVDLIDVYDGVFVFGSSDTTWAAATGLGDANSVYVEDSTCTYTANQGSGACMESGSGGSYVFRYNTTTGGGTGQHGACEAGDRGHRRTEVYHNTFTANTGHSFAGSTFFGGTGVNFANRYIGITIPILFTYKRACQAEVTGNGCVGIYNSVCFSAIDDVGNHMCKDQPGAGQNQASEPIYVWNNCTQAYSCPDDGSVCTCGGAGYVASLQGYSAYGCDTQLNALVQENVDYYNQTVKTGYTPYTYPHPLQGAVVVPSSFSGTTAQGVTIR